MRWKVSNRDSTVFWRWKGTHTMCEGSEHEVSWDDGRRVVELGMLAESLESCCFCQQPIQLKNVVDEKRYGLASWLYIQCSCGQINTVTSRNSVTLKFGDNSIAIYPLKWSVTPTFLSRNTSYLQLSPYCPKINKKSMWEVLKISSFLSTWHRILLSCGCKVRDTMVPKCELVL